VAECVTDLLSSPNHEGGDPLGCLPARCDGVAHLAEAGADLLSEPGVSSKPKRTMLEQAKYHDSIKYVALMSPRETARIRRTNLGRTKKQVYNQQIKDPREMARKVYVTEINTRTTRNTRNDLTSF
jgi:hypothetical protein